MIIRLEDKGVFRSYLVDLQRFRMPKREHAIIARLLQDAKRGQVNTDRLKYAMPILAKYRGVLGDLIGRTFSFRSMWLNVPLMAKAMIFPVLYLYFFSFLPMRRKHLTGLKRVDETLANLSERTKNIRVTVKEAK